MTVRRHLSKGERGIWDNIPAPSLVLSSAKETQKWREPQIDLLCPGFHLGWGGGGGSLRGFCVTTVK